MCPLSLSNRSAEAVVIPLGVRHEHGNVDFMLQVVPTARVSGTVVREALALGGAMLTLVPDDPRWVGARSTYSGRVKEDGTFSVTGVPPGRYVAIEPRRSGAKVRFLARR